VDRGLLQQRGPCPIVDFSGASLGSIQPGALFGTNARLRDPTIARQSVFGREVPRYEYEMCSATNTFVVADTPGVVEEFCHKCVDGTVVM